MRLRVLAASVEDIHQVCNVSYWTWKRTSCILRLRKRVLVNLQASSLTRTHPSNAETTRDFAPITLRFLFQPKGVGGLHKTSLVSLKGLKPSQSIMKRIASSHRELDLLATSISNAFREGFVYLFIFLITTLCSMDSLHHTPSASIPVTFSA